MSEFTESQEYELSVLKDDPENYPEGEYFRMREQYLEDNAAEAAKEVGTADTELRSALEGVRLLQLLQKYNITLDDVEALVDACYSESEDLSYNEFKKYAPEVIEALFETHGRSIKSLTESIEGATEPNVRACLRRKGVSVR